MPDVLATNLMTALLLFSQIFYTFRVKMS